MSQDIYSQFLRFEIEESVNATFTEGSAILTGASVNRIQGQNIAIEVHAIGVELSMPEDLPATGATEYVGICLSTRSGLTTMPNLNAEHLIYRNQKRLKAGVGTYLPLIFTPDEYMPQYTDFKNPLLISHAKLYPYIISSNSSSKATGFGFLLFTYVLLDADLAIEALETFR